VIKGQVKVGDQTLQPGDGASVENVADLTFEATEKSEFLVFDLA